MVVKCLKTLKLPESTLKFSKKGNFFSVVKIVTNSDFSGNNLKFSFFGNFPRLSKIKQVPKNSHTHWKRQKILK